MNNYRKNSKKPFDFHILGKEKQEHNGSVRSFNGKVQSFHSPRDLNEK